MTHPRTALAAAVCVLAASASARAAPPTYIVQLSDAPVATYDGGVASLQATRALSGHKLDSSAAPVRNYLAYLERRAAAESTRVGARRSHRYSYVFNGFSAQLSEAQVKALRASPAVVSITPSEMLRPETITTPIFLGLTQPGGLWSTLDAGALQVKGENVVIGIIDTGIWPEDASFGDRVDAQGKPVPYFGTGTLAYGPAPAKWRGTCQVGEGFTASMCNNKLIGARFYADAFLSSGYTLDSFEYLSPRNGTGHGSHTASTAGGNGDAAAWLGGDNLGLMSGIAPRARLAMYKACWNIATAVCASADTVKAIDDAVMDGVDVINFSIGGTRTNFADPVQVAFFNAAAAGVFVAASAGNSGSTANVSSISPWLTTVAASTHDRYLVAPVLLGSGASFSGVSYNTNGVPSRPLILAQDAGPKPFSSLSVNDQTALTRCYGASDRAGSGASDDAALDPAKAAGHIVVCLRGGNALVNKASTVQTAGGAGVVIQNVPGLNNTPVQQPYALPTVQLDASAYPTVVAYAASSGATASFGPRALLPGQVIAPVMASDSSRGPSLAEANILKPDITAPGVDIIAAWNDTSLTQVQHDAVAANTWRPQANAVSVSGTSMSSPHVAGAGALLKQLHPTWSAAAIKSALMTSATGVKLASGAPDPDRFGYGAGHLNLNGAADPGLVYDISTADYARFLCGQNLTPPPGIGNCAALGTLLPENLNLASLTAAYVVGTKTLTRTVTNVSPATSTYGVNASLAGWTVDVNPSSMTLAPGAKGTFTTTLTRTTAPINTWVFGSLAWFDGTHTVTSPLTAYASNAFAAPAEVSDVRPGGKGTKVFQITSSYTGSMTVAATGLVPATVTPGAVSTGGTQCTNVDVPTGAQVARFQLFDADTGQGSAGSAPTNLDLQVYNGPNGTGARLGSSTGVTSSEVVTLKAPSAGSYSACVVGMATAGAGATYKLSSWVVGPALGTQTLRAAGPNSLYAAGTASITTGWSVTAGQRYLGNIVFTDMQSRTLGTTVVLVDNH